MAGRAKTTGKRRGEERKRRLRVSGQLPPLPEDSAVPYAASRPEFKGEDEVDYTLAILRSNAWREVMVPILDAVEVARRGARGPAPLYTAHELEAISLYQRVLGHRSYKRTRERIASDLGRKFRRALGLSQDRKRRGGTGQKLLAGVPSIATMHRFRLYQFPEELRAQTYEEFDARLFEEELQLPDVREELLLLDTDGSAYLTHYKAERGDRRGDITRTRRVTAPEAGYMPKNKRNHEKAEDGWNWVTITTHRGRVVAQRLVPIHTAESVVALELIEEVGELRRRLGLDELGVLSADGNFHSHRLRQLCREQGLVENIHLASHAKRDSSERNAARKQARRIPIANHENWFANGHRELVCRCGQGRTYRRAKLVNGSAVVRVEGECRACGRISITSGHWRLLKNPARFVRCQPGEQDEADWAFGNPLSYNDPLARAYGHGRFGHQEGFYGQMVSRFRLLKHKHWFRRQSQAELELRMTTCIMRALAIEQAHRSAANAAQSTGPPGPPGLALAA